MKHLKLQYKNQQLDKGLKSQFIQNVLSKNIKYIILFLFTNCSLSLFAQRSFQINYNIGARTNSVKITNFQIAKDPNCNVVLVNQGNGLKILSDGLHKCSFESNGNPVTGPLICSTDYTNQDFPTLGGKKRSIYFGNTEVDEFSVNYDTVLFFSAGSSRFKKIVLRPQNNQKEYDELYYKKNFLYQGELGPVTLVHCQIDTLIIDSLNINSEIRIFKTKISVIIFNHCYFETPMVLKGDMPNWICLKDNNFSNEGQLNLTNLENLERNGKNCRFRIENTDLAKVSFDYKYFDLDTSNTSKQDRDFAYSRILENQKKNGFEDGEKKIDIESKKYKYSQHYLGKIQDAITMYWWEYGYSKFKILGWTLLFIAIFTLLNVVLWNNMQVVYPIFDEESKSNVYLKRNLFWSLIYTSYIFFSLKVDFGKIKPYKKFYVFLFFFEYTVGLICVFFIFNALLKF